MNFRWRSSDTTTVTGSSAQDIFVFGPFLLHAAQRRIERNGSPIQLSDRAFDILLTLIIQAGTVVSKSDLMASAWPGVNVDEGSLRVHVAALRKALGDGRAGAKYLSTVSGQGYCFVGSVSRRESAEPAPVRSPPAHDHNLPACPRLTTGRERTIEDISEKLKVQRFVTIVGPGGIGKTTVAVSIGHALLADFAGQVHFLSLGEIGDAALVPGIAASALGLPARSNDPSGSLAAFLRDRRMLLILDCCEHVIETAAALAERLFKEAPELHILATSRELLRVEGEHIHRLPPLASPPEDAALTAASARTYPAVELFVERATAGGSEFELTDANASDVGNLCRRLDGIPLAIELTASHVCAYGVKSMLELLDKHFNLLWEGRRTALPRHRTLRATIEWSFNLLSEPERVILGRLSVFVGSFTLEAAQSIAASELIDDDMIMAALASLAAKSMLTLSTGSTRYRLPDTTRAYAQEKLAGRVDGRTMAQRHALYFLGLLERVGDETDQHLSAIADQVGNIRCALTWCFSDQGDRRTGVALTAASIPLFFKLSLLAECQLWVTRAIEALDQTAGNVRYDLALHAALGSARLLTGQIDDLSVACFNRALELAEKTGDAPSQIRLIDRLHLLQLFAGNFDDALKTAKRGEAVAIASEDPAAVARMRVSLSISYHYLGDVAASRAYIEAALRRPGMDAKIHGDLPLNYTGRAHITLARILWLQGHPDQAAETARRVVSHAITANHPIMLCRALLSAFAVFYWNEELENYEEHIDRLVVETRRHGLATFQIVGEAMKGMALLARGEADPGLAMLKSSVEKLQSQRFGVVAGLCAPLATALAATDHGDEALDTIDRAIAQARHCNFMMEMPDMMRARAEVLMRSSKPDFLQAERSLKQSLELARYQGTLGYELRTAISLTRLWLRQGRREEALDMLAPIYGRFTEGFHTRGLTAAREFLAELGSTRSGSLAAH
jgi:predicted ATPase/DNA-binding winged helix-turn-helix (wHTH) protein